MGRKNFDSSSELQNELRALKQSKWQFPYFPQYKLHMFAPTEPPAYLFSSTTSIQCMHVTVFCMENTWRISAFSTPHRTTCLVSPRLKAKTGEERMEFSRFTWQRRSEPGSHGRSLLLPSGLQARAVISFPVYSLGCRLHTRWKLAKRWRSSYRKQNITQP